MKKNAEPVLHNLKNQMLGLPFDEQILTTQRRYTHFNGDTKRVIIQDDILDRQYYNDVGDISHLQILLPVQLINILLNSLHGEARHL